MFSPGKKNWIKKFFSLVEKGELSFEEVKLPQSEPFEEHFREIAEHTGILYGVPNQLIFTQDYVGSATRNEKLQVLLFESLLYIDLLHRKDPFNKAEFIERLQTFYHSTEKIPRPWFTFIGKREASNQIEEVLSERIKVHSSYSNRNFWFNHLTNGFLYLDLILFHQSYSKNLAKDDFMYRQWVEAVITTIQGLKSAHPEASAFFDKTMFRNLLLSAELPDEITKQVKRIEPEEKLYKNALNVIANEPMLAHFTFHFLVFLYHGYPSEAFNRESFLTQFGKTLGLNEEQITEVFWECRKSMSDHSSEFYHLVSESESKILTTHLTRKYNRILGRNKDRLVQELKESKELVYLIRQSALRELTPEEKEKVKTQSMDLMKSVPSIGIYLIPGGALWLPLVLKLLPDLLPSAFKENEVEEKK